MLHKVEELEPAETIAGRVDKELAEGMITYEHGDQKDNIEDIEK